jgi:hypothetical protein
MSDTPRTDLMVERAPIGLRTNAAFEQSCDLCRQLERELNATNERIKRLEEAGDAMADVLVWSSGTQYKRSPTASEWRKAKEAKP